MIKLAFLATPYSHPPASDALVSLKLTCHHKNTRSRLQTYRARTLTRRVRLLTIRLVTFLFPRFPCRPEPTYTTIHFEIVFVSRVLVKIISPCLWSRKHRVRTTHCSIMHNIQRHVLACIFYKHVIDKFADIMALVLRHKSQFWCGRILSNEVVWWWISLLQFPTVF